MMQDEPTLSLFDVSSRLGVSPSAIKKRVAQLNLPVQRGARGKLIFDRRAYNLLMQADELLKAGHGFEECRRRLGLEAPARPIVTVFAPAADVHALPADEPASEPLEADERDDEPVVVAEPELPVTLPAVASPAPAGEEPTMRKLPPPVFIQLGRNKRPPAPSPDLVARLDAALRLLEEKERHNQMLQAKLLVAYDEMTKLSATAAAFQERSLNLSHEVQKLQGELKMIEGPARRPWWKFWGRS